MKPTSKTKKYLFFSSIVFAFFCFAHSASAATDFVAVVDPGNGTGTDFTSIYNWQNGMTVSRTATVDLTSANTQVFAGTATGTLNMDIDVYQCRGGSRVSPNISGRLVLASKSGQALVKTITAGASFSTNDRWFPTADCSGANYFNITASDTVKDSIAKCRATGGIGEVYTSSDTTWTILDHWTTSSSHYVKIWTDPSENYRHQGKWNTAKYYIKRSTATGFPEIKISIPYVRIDGLQIQVDQTAGNPDAIYVDAGAGSVYISNNIIKQTGSANAGNGMSLQASATLYVYNNIIYGFKGNPYGAIVTYNTLAYVYNNTLYNNYFGAYSTSGTNTVLVNNIMSGNTYDAYPQSFSASSMYNILSNNPNTIAWPGSNFAWGATWTTGTANSDVLNHLVSSTADFSSVQVGSIVANTTASTYSYVTAKNSATDLTLANDIFPAGTGSFSVYKNKYGAVSFTSTTAGSEDFHLLISDTVARDMGYDAHADSNSPFNTDIDGQSRPNGAWDIGADEFPIPMPVYYSVGQNTSSLMAGTSVTVTITSGAAVLNVAQTGNIGAGDYIEYGTAPYNRAYISAKTNADQMHWSVVTAIGGTPTDVTGATVNSIKHTFSTLNSAVASASGASYVNNTDLTAANVILNIPCYYDSAADTTGVTVSGYTTDATRYIRIYTPVSTTAEANFSQRHQGKYDLGKYRLEVSEATGIVTNATNFIRIDGLQISVAASVNTSKNGISIKGANAGDTADIQVSNNIVSCNFSGSATSNNGIISYWGVTSANTFKIWNNIVYGAKNGSAIGMNAITVSGGVAYVYNNTVLNSHIGINYSTVVDTYVAKNNIAYNNDFDYTSGGNGFAAASSNNVTKDATSPNKGAADCGGHYCTSQTVVFADATNKDFHLNPTDTAARNSGADLAGDTLPITTDIDGQARPTGTNINDIGADEGATAIYYSVGQNTTDHKTLGAGGSAPTITVSGYTATLNVGQSAPNMGVGDRINYTGGSCYISAKTNADYMHWNCQNATGGTAPQVSTVAVTSIVHAASNLADMNWNVGNDSKFINSYDLVTGNYIVNIPCYYDTGPEVPTGSGVSPAGNFITSAANYVRFYTPVSTVSEANASQRAVGKWDTNKYRIEYTASGQYSAAVNFGSGNNVNVRIEGWQVWITSNYASNRGMLFYNSIREAYISNCIIRGTMLSDNAEFAGIELLLTSSNVVNKSKPNVRIWNNIVYGFNGTSANNAGIYSSTDNLAYMYIYNNTVYNSKVGYAIGGNVSAVTFAKNNIAQNTTTGYSGAFDSSSTNNISDHADAPPYNTIYNSATVAFSDSANKDFHLAANDTAARNTGADLSADSYLAFNTDIDGHSRVAPAGRLYDVGADQGATAIYYSIGQSTAPDMKTGTPTITVSNYAATFNSAQSGNIGVGDIITYTGGSCFISGKTNADQMHWNCQNATGGTAPPVSGVSVTSIKRAFGSLYRAAYDAYGSSFLNTADLQTNNYQLNIPCYYDTGPDTTYGVSFSDSTWTTAAPNYIRIYTPTNTSTEANASQRHRGIAGTGYILRPSNTAPSNNVSIINAFVDSRIDGLEIDGSGITNGKTVTGLQSYAANTNKRHETWFSNNLVHDIKNSTADDSSSRYVFAIYSQRGSTKIFNNIVYAAENKSMASGSSSAGIYLSSDTPESKVIYNNTVYGVTNTGNGSAYGFNRETQTATNVVSNNAIGNTTCTQGGCSHMDYGGFSGATASYNVSADATADDAGGSGYKINQALTSTFVSISGNDYHLAQTDTVAKNAGTNLSADSNFAFSSDIDGVTRNVDGRGYDIGADEAATQVFYSVGQNTADLRSSTAPTTLTIDASGNGTLDVAQTGNVGVGDYIEYGTAPYARAYITGKSNADQLHWTVQSATGSLLGVGTTMPVNAIKHTWATLNSAVAGSSGVSYINTTDLQTNNYQLNIPCYYDSAADTTAVTVSSYTTGPTTYIKAYTPISTTAEANFSQRHQGKWDDARYRLENTGTVVLVYINNVTFDGIQIKLTKSNSTGSTALNFDSSISGQGQIYLRNNIIRGVMANLSTASIGTKYYPVGYTPTVKPTFYIYNNIIYGFSSNNAGYGLYFFAPAYIYNNTVYGNYYGIFGEGSTINFAKNNIASANAIDYNASSYFNASSSNNISSDATSPNSTLRNKTVNFVDAPHGDFHLAQNDTSAREAGADLRADANLPITSDIDGNSRPGLVLTDIGADEAATYIYYSVGQNTTDHKTGSPNITLSGYSATLTVGQTAPNMGVGDLITYTGGSCYISGKTDTQHWNCQNATGGTAPQVSGVSVTSIAHAFDSLKHAVDSSYASSAKDSSHLNTVDIKSNNYILNIPCYYDTGADTTSTQTFGWKTSAPNYIKIYTPNNTSTEVNVSQRHSGKWDDSKYKMEISNNYGLQIASSVGDNYVTIDGLQIAINVVDTNSVYGIYSGSTTTSNYVVISNNIVKGAVSGTSTTTRGIFVYSTSQSPAGAKVYNNIVYDIANGTNDCAGIRFSTGTGNFYAYNNTVYNSRAGFSQGNGVAILKNNIGQNNNADYSGTFDANSTNNVSGTAPTTAIAFGATADSGTTTSASAGKLIQSGKNFGTTVKVGMIVKNTTDSTYTYVTAVDSATQLSVATAVPSGKAYTIYTNRYGTVGFQDATNKNFHLASTDTVAKNQGISLASDSNLYFQNDIDGDQRTGTWSIGADDGPFAAVNSDQGTVNNSATAGLSYGLVGYWPFNGDDIVAGTAYDRSGQNNNGILLAGSAPTPTIGNRGQGLSFNGTNNKIINNTFSSKVDAISLWVKPKITITAASNEQQLMDFANAGGVGTCLGSCFSAIPNDTIGIINVPGNGARTAVQNFTFAAGQWYHLVFTWNNAEGKYNIYINGIKQTTVNSGADTPEITTTTGMIIGQGDDGDTFGINGSLDEVRVYNRALSPSEITSLYKLGGETVNTSQAGKATNGLVGHWTFDGANMKLGIGGTAYDSSGQNNNGIIGGTAPGPVAAIGKLGQALSFNGTSGNVVVPHGASIDNLDTVTISAWIYLNGAGGGGYGRILDKSSKLTFYQDGTRIRFDAGRWDTYGDWYSANNAIGTGQWYHVAVTYDYSNVNNAPVFYVNGAVSATSVYQAASGSKNSESSNISLGDNGTSNTRVFNGKMDDVRLYNRVLSATEIGDLYRMGHAVVKK